MAKLLLLLLLVLLGLPVFLLISGVQDTPLVAPSDSMRHADAGRITDLLKQHDPRSLRDGDTRRLEISARDLNLILGSALPGRIRQFAHLDLEDTQATLNYTIALPENPLGKYLNLSAQLRQNGQRLELRQMTFGDVPLPAWLTTLLVNGVDRILRSRSVNYRDVIGTLKDIQIGPQTLTIVYQWQSGLVERLQSSGRDLLLPPGERQKIVTYYKEISRISQTLPRAAVSLDELLQPLFSLAQSRSSENREPASENRALLLALGVAVSGSAIDNLVGEQDAAGTQRPLYINLTLRGRSDLASHFAISAAITAAGGGALADHVGVFKEVDDSRGGSGFSFADLLADRAGVSLAETALGPKAAALQDYMNRRIAEAGYMPAFDQLPEGLLELEFKARYEDLDSATYALVNKEIELRISRCTIHRRDFR